MRASMVMSAPAEGKSMVDRWQEVETGRWDRVGVGGPVVSKKSIFTQIVPTKTISTLSLFTPIIILS